MDNIRNFCIIAHIDHGKSTLADRMLQITNTVLDKDMKHGQILDTMDLEQERGITIKLRPVRMEYETNGSKYVLNLIDTPGHVDFSYEVSRSLAACEGAVLVVDATQGIQAQTLANTYLAVEHNLEIVPCLNKIDLPAADVDKYKGEIEHLLGVPKDEIIAISAKEGTNVDLLLKRIVEILPSPRDNRESGESKALIFDSVYDIYRGVVTYVRVKEGILKKGDIVKFLHNGKEVEILELGYFGYKPFYLPKGSLSAGEVGYIVTGLKQVAEARVGDTIWKGDKNIVPTPLPGYKKVKPYVFAGIFSVEGDDYPVLRDALEKLSLNDSALVFEPEQSQALGHGFRCGFLGLLHLDIIQERLEREYGLDLIVTAPSVSYKVILKGGEQVEISSPSDLPEVSKIEEIKEPWVKLEIVVPKDRIGGVMDLVQSKRGTYISMSYLDLDRVILNYEIPLSSIIVDFYDNLKSVSSGYASMNYEFLDYRKEALIKLDIFLAGELIPPLSSILHRSEAYYLGRKITEKLKDLIPRQMFEIPIQAAIGGKIIARETIPAMRKDVTAKLYGGDRTRKDKLLKKQKEGKKRMKQVGKVNLPQEAFLAILRKD